MGPSVLDRLSTSFSQNEFTETQSQVDRLVSGFVEHATDGRSLAAMTAGGMAYRLGRIGVLSAEIKNFESLRWVSSLAVGLGSEASAFEMTNRLIVHAPNLWQWDGPGGIRQGWLSSLITFGSLKCFGKLAEGQNLILQHGFQDAGMVLGHQLAYLAGIGPRPEGTIAQQFLNAEAANLQLASGMSLVHSSFPKLVSLERGIERALPSHEGRTNKNWPILSPRFVWEGISQEALKSEKETFAAERQYILSSRGKDDQKGSSPLSEQDHTRIFGPVKNAEELSEQNRNDLKEVITRLSPPERYYVTVEL